MAREPTGDSAAVGSGLRSGAGGWGWRASSAGGGIFFEVPHSSGLFSRQGTPLFEDTCEACGERSVGGRGGATARRRLCVQSRCVAPSVGTGCVAA